VLCLALGLQFPNSSKQQRCRDCTSAKSWEMRVALVFFIEIFGRLFKNMKKYFTQWRKD
jgi:hypothetical protein